ncbi:transporter substrate-binding domain-containing protein [Lichenifustis flavocetrariae]|uniref:Transporter substrate-binding domain-containing protein n=1 Tax=Lichenifustis flavocetrariae TaxID=2949735 RepID=A0AA41Z105_9HYPH|nr:transporter substrate-binding domain-containing protein [Lichenifustis flavocetrariae]MCW6510860.1 transporter substrate-binding domain-containing protein [Lichenifustis flavocetrariae]
MSFLRQFAFTAALGAALLFGPVATASAEDALARVKSSGELKVGTETAFAPFDFIDAGAHVGLNVDLFDEIGKEMGVKITWVALPWEGVLPGLEAGKFDMVAGPATITKARMARYRFLPPIGDATDALLKRKDDKSVEKPADIAGKTVGAGKASSQLAQLQAYVATLPGKVTIREYVGNNEAYADLAAGRIVAVANSLTNIAFVAKQRSDTFEVVQPAFGPKSYFGYIAPKDAEHASLTDAAQAAILKIKADGRLAALQKKWFGASFDTPDAVPEPNL